MKPLQIIEGYAKLTAKELGLMKSNPKAAARFAKCVTCPNLQKGWCDLCVCYMPAKVEVNNAFCPKGLWL